MGRQVRVIFAVDPGGTTGWAMAMADGTVTYGQEKPLPFCSLAHGYILAAVEAGEHIEVVSESYTIHSGTAQKSRQYDALEQIGTLRYLTFWLTGGELILQSPADAKRLITNPKLKALGYWAVGMDHARDALRHLAYRQLKRGLIKLPH